jgi:hypothetical protein
MFLLCRYWTPRQICLRKRQQSDSVSVKSSVATRSNNSPPSRYSMTERGFTRMFFLLLFADKIVFFSSNVFVNMSNREEETTLSFSGWEVSSYHFTLRCQKLVCVHNFTHTCTDMWTRIQLAASITCLCKSVADGSK